MSEIKEFTEVQKNNAAIHIDTTDLSLTHRKAFNILLWNAWDELDKNKVHVMGVWELMEMLGHHDIHRLKIELEKMPTIGVTWNLLRDDGWPISSGACALLAGFNMVGNNFRYSFFEDFRPLLKNPQLWTKIKIEIANLFKSSYALALYENCARFANVGSTGFKELEEWKELIGIPDNVYYKTFSRINEKIIKPAIKEINKLSDIKIATEYIKKGRGGAVRKIKFNIEKKPNFRVERQLTIEHYLNKEDVERQCAAFAPNSKPAKELQEKQLKPAYLIFESEPDDYIKQDLAEKGFEFWAKHQAWVNRKTNPATPYRLAQKYGAKASLGFPEKTEKREES